MLKRLVMLTALVVCACAPTPPTPGAISAPPSPTRIEEGRQLAQHYCASCHAIGAHDSSPNVNAPPLRMLAQRYRMRELDDAFTRGLLANHPAMPHFSFTQPELDALAAYIQAAQVTQDA